MVLFDLPIVCCYVCFGSAVCAASLVLMWLGLGGLCLVMVNGLVAFVGWGIGYFNLCSDLMSGYLCCDS